MRFRPSWLADPRPRDGVAAPPRLPPLLGRWGMELLIEPSVRGMVADRMGVAGQELVPGISLRDDLAAEPRDLLDLALALEAMFAIVVPERAVERMRTYGDLVRITGLLIRSRADAEARGAEPAPRIWVRIVPPAGVATGTLERAEWLTPYVAETIAEDARRAAPGARLEVLVAGRDAAVLARLRRRFAGLPGGARVTVRGDDARPPRTAVAPDAPRLPPPVASPSSAEI